MADSEIVGGDVVEAERPNEGREGVGCGEGYPLPTGVWGWGCGPPQKKFSILDLKMASFGALDPPLFLGL